MTCGASEMSEKRSDKSKSVKFAAAALKEKIAPPGSCASVEGRIRLASRRLGWSFSRTKDVWYADERVVIDPDEMLKIEEKAGVRYGRSEVATIEELIEIAEALLAREDAAGDWRLVAAIRAFFGVLGRSRA